MSALIAGSKLLGRSRAPEPLLLRPSPFSLYAMAVGSLSPSHPKHGGQREMVPPPRGPSLASVLTRGWVHRHRAALRRCPEPEPLRRHSVPDGAWLSSFSRAAKELSSRVTTVRQWWSSPGEFLSRSVHSPSRVRVRVRVSIRFANRIPSYFLVLVCPKS